MMKRVFLMSAAIGLFAGGRCLSQVAYPVPQQDVSLVGQAASAIATPWLTFVLIVLGMTLIVVESVAARTCGLAGSVGILMVGFVLAAHIAVGTATLSGVALLAAGVSLLMTEARVLRGYAVSALLGIVCQFLGLYHVLGGYSAGVIYPIVTSAIFTLMSAIVFLIYLPKDSEWIRLARRAQITCGRSSATVELGKAETTGTEVEADETSRRVTGHLAQKNSTDEDQQRIVRRD